MNFLKCVPAAVFIAVMLSCGGKGGGNTAASATAPPAVTAAGSFAGNIVPGTPSGSSIKLNVYSAEQSGLFFISYGVSSGAYDHSSDLYSLKSGVPLEIPLSDLSADAKYYYRLNFKSSAENSFGYTDEFSFHTARTSGSTFVFGVQGDSHPEREKSEFDPALYRRTLQTAAADNPDFYILLGDDFSVDNLNYLTVTLAQVAERYSIQRPYLGIIGKTSPVYLVNGNHEQAARYLLNGTSDNVAVWAQNARNSFYSQPAPDAFYSGNTEQIQYVGLLRNYFSWTWGDALFIVIDPYWESPVCVDEPFDGSAKRSNLWDVTHGDAQYQWLKTTLEQSAAKYKFVFAHHVMGTGRGGIDIAGKYEWGGYNNNGKWGLSANRPSWTKPIHQLMADNKVTIFFQGHDHVWVTQSLDGVVYQTLPEPADPNYSLFNADAFLSGDKLPNTGYARVTVSPSLVKVEYVRIYLPADEGAGKVSGSAVYSYSFP